MTALALDYQTPQRMGAKLKAIPLPVMRGKRVLDVGCDAGFFSFLAADRGASDVLGLDRNRYVKGVGHVDLVAFNRERAEQEDRASVRFEQINLGKEWREFGKFDVIFVCSLYHHIYEAAGHDHHPIWFWLWRHCSSDGVVIWENPVDDADPVVRANVSDRSGYARDAILQAASRHFEAEFVGPALHEPTREVWQFRPKIQRLRVVPGTIVVGAGGASKAFAHACGRRIDEIERAIGVRPCAGSLNIKCDVRFDWSRGYYRAQVFDVVDRAAGLDSEWALRWARFYPLTVESIDAVVFRFEGDSYPETFVELIAAARLRDMIDHDNVMLCN